MNIGFIGVGAMGAAMVPHLVRAGHQVGVWNRNPAACARLEGVTVLDSAAQAFDNEVVLTMLSEDSAVRAVILQHGVLQNARKDCVHVMMATISVQLAGELAALHREAGIAYVAAPVFGVPAVAAAAQLNIVAAGDPAALARLQPLFDVLGRKTWPMGEDPRRANIAKISGNMMIALAIEAMGEAAALSESYGLPAADLLDLLTNTIFASPSYQRYGSFIASGSYEPGFKLRLGLKDVNLALSAAEASGTALPGVEVVREHMHTALKLGLESRDWSVFASIPRGR
ncbi:NAD(P)-dependent oxidoreductase [Oxalobacteraceae bacterium A2-2]